MHDIFNHWDSNRRRFMKDPNDYIPDWTEDEITEDYLNKRDKEEEDEINN